MLLDSEESEGVQLPIEFEIIEVCRYMGGWSLQEYLDAPKKFVEYIKLKMSTEYTHAEWKSKNLSKTNVRNR